MSYEMKSTDVYDFARSIGAETKEHGDELEFKYCPQCQGGTSKDEHTFSINIRTGAFCCQRASCGYKGHFVELCRDFNYPLEFETAKVYKDLPQPREKIKPADAAVKYLATRAISERVANDYEITVDDDNPNVLVFPFYDENGQLVFKKYRNTKFKKGDKGNKEWCEKDTMPILFGMKQCKSFDRLIITEGQLDSLSVAEAGFDNAVSVPTGAKGFTWWMPCKEWVNKFKEIIVFGDYENGKISLVDELLKRIPDNIKVVRKQDYLGEKDANDILRKYGLNAIRKCIENAEVPSIFKYPESHLADDLDFDDVEEPEIFVEGLLTQGLYLLNAPAKNGKSRLTLQLLIDICKGQKFLDVFQTQKCEVLYLALEDEERDFKPRFKKFIGYSARPKGFHYLLKTDFEEDNLPRLGEDGGLSDLIREQVKKYPNIRFIAIDVLGQIRSKRTSKDFTEDERKDLNELLSLALELNCCILVSHHVAKNGVSGFRSSDSATGSGAGSFVVGGTVHGELALMRDPKDRSHATLRAEGRRTPSVAVYLHDNFPRWDYECTLSEHLQESKDNEIAQEYNAIVETCKYLIERDGKWRGTSKQLQAENEINPDLPAFTKCINKNSFSQALVNMLKVNGIVYKQISSGTASKIHSLSPLSSGDQFKEIPISSENFDAEQSSIFQDRKLS